MKRELRRQFLHFFFGSIIIILIVLMETKNFLVLNAAILLAGFFLSLKIKNKRRNIPVIKELLNYAGRTEEKALPGKGAITFFVGTLIATILFYDNNVLLIGAIIPLVFGDSVSTVTGKLIGRTKIIDKTLEGSLAGILVSFIYLSVLFPFSVALVASIAGMSMEYLPIEDNYTIPIATGFTLMLLI
jgi:dolichol kinase